MCRKRQRARRLEWDLGFLASGVVLMLAGWLLARAGRGERRARGVPHSEPLGAH